jgi:hypothetical protein
MGERIGPFELAVERCAALEGVRMSPLMARKNATNLSGILQCIDMTNVSIGM